MQRRPDTGHRSSFGGVGGPQSTGMVLKGSLNVCRSATSCTKNEDRSGNSNFLKYFVLFFWTGLTILIAMGNEGWPTWVFLCGTSVSWVAYTIAKMKANIDDMKL